MKKKIVILVAFIFSLSVAACGNRSTSSNENNGKSVTVEDNMNAESVSGDTEHSNQATEIKETEKVSEEDDVYNIGDSAVLKDWEIGVTSVQIVDSIAGDYGKFSPDEDGNKYVQVYATVYNNGKQADNFLPSFGMRNDVSAKVLYGDGYEFSATNLLGYSKELHDSSINPLSSKSGEIAFEVPETVATSTDELILQFTSGNDDIKFKIR